MPGPGLVAVHAAAGYLRADERDDEFGTKGIHDSGHRYTHAEF